MYLYNKRKQICIKAMINSANFFVVLIFHKQHGIGPFILIDFLHASQFYCLILVIYLNASMY